MTFKLDYDQSLLGSFLISCIAIVPKKLVEAFGESETGVSPDKKTSGEYPFVCVENPEVFFVLYDYKQTSIYNSDYEDVKEFWEAETVRDFHIGGNVNTEKYINEIKDWVRNQLK